MLTLDDGNGDVMTFNTVDDAERYLWGVATEDYIEKVRLWALSADEPVLVIPNGNNDKDTWTKR